MSADSPLWLTESDVVSLLDLRAAIAALERGVMREARGAARNMVKTHVTWDGGHSLHAIGAVFSSEGIVGTKTWAHTEGGATPLLILFDAHTGSLKAIIEAFALGQLRTGGISGVATRWLAGTDADELAIVGTGKQALAQVAAVAAVRALRRVRVFSPDRTHRVPFAERVRSELGISTSACDSVEDTVADAAIVTVATRATEPFLTSAMLARGSHINAVGAIALDRIEFAGDIFPRCAQVVADNVVSVQQLSREFIDYYSAGDWSQVASLSTIVAEQRTRPHHADLTLFKAMGMGISDMALGIELFERATRTNVGRRLDQPKRAQPQLGEK